MESTGWYVDVTLTGLDISRHIRLRHLQIAPVLLTHAISKFTLSDGTDANNASTSGVTVIATFRSVLIPVTTP
jgi:hypothetical protein